MLRNYKCTTYVYMYLRVDGKYTVVNTKIVYIVKKLRHKIKQFINVQSRHYIVRIL